MTTTPQTLTLAAFLEARLDDDEAAARAAMVVIGDDLTEHRVGEWWAKPEHSRVYAGHWHKVAQAGVTSGDPVFHNTAALPHIARHDPARVLAEVEAKRAVLAMLTDLTDDGEWLSREDESDQWLLTKVLRLLALPHAGHPDYREEWRP